MDSDCIDYRKLPQFSELIRDYLDQNTTLQWAYNRFPTLSNYGAQIQEKAAHYPHDFRKIVVETLHQQYKNIAYSKATQNNIDALLDRNTFTVTTGHQLNLLTGPLYCIYKIISVINQCKQLQKQYPENRFVPVYWMATEDHDFEEIQSFHFEQTKITWKTEQKGAVGRFVIDASFDPTREQLLATIPSGERGDYLRNLFLDAYKEGQTLAEATRYLVHELFQEEGIVILDGDALAFKKVLVPYLQKEITESTSFHSVQHTITQLSPYPIQVNPREINLFYLTDGSRERIIKKGNSFKINTTGQTFEHQELVDLIAQQPELFSPNVLLRPLYQEVLLPNLGYIGGGGELAYWLELKAMFAAFAVPFPIVQLRNSVLNVSLKQEQKREKLHVNYSDLFLSETELRTLATQRLSTLNFDFSAQKELLKAQFENLKLLASQTDKSFIGAVLAQERKQMKGLDHLQKRMLKAEKRVHQQAIERIINLQLELFPNHVLQERVVNFSSFYMQFGPKGLERLRNSLHPLSSHFSIFIYE